MVDKDGGETSETCVVEYEEFKVDPSWGLQPVPLASGRNIRYYTTVEKQAIFDLWLNNAGIGLAHVVGSDCTLGAGFALEFKTRYPSMCPKYKPKGERPDVPWILRFIEDSKKGPIPRGVLAYHMVAKPLSGIPGVESEKLYKQALTTCVSEVMKDLKKGGERFLIMPYLIGTGKDGLDEEWVADMILDLATKNDVCVILVNLQ